MGTAASHLLAELPPDVARLRGAIVSLVQEEYLGTNVRNGSGSGTGNGNDAGNGNDNGNSNDDTDCCMSKSYQCLTTRVHSLASEAWRG